jgi:hypothetical protein
MSQRIEMDMETADRLKTYVGFADIGRKWATVMDAKAAFLSALNAGQLAFLWGGMKFENWSEPSRSLGLISTCMTLLSLAMTLWVITPREKLSALVGRKSRWTEKYKPISFYGYIAKHYAEDGFEVLESDLAMMDEADFAREALEQHFAISRIIQKKSEWIQRAAFLTFAAVLCISAGLIIRIVAV